jgi:murein DD-endopeptidase MepM/ murein hydrolase activator NlpD
MSALKKIIIGLGILIAVSGLAFIILLIQPWVYLPHSRPVLILPFDAKYDAYAGIMPMGEKINHPDAPSGHPGIDFGFDNVKDPVPYIAAMDGTITSVKITKNPDMGGKDKISLSKTIADVFISNGTYQIRYGELDAATLPSSTKRGNKVKAGDFIGYGNFSTGLTPDVRREMTHWEFRSQSLLIDRLCPLSYFTPDSRERIEAIWAKTDWPEMKAQYPKICNGDYDGKEF